MFGYVKPYVPLLTVAQYEVYKGVYCGLCRAMGKVTGQLSRMSLSYDFAFLALFRMALLKTKSEFDRKSCIAHPFSKKTYMKENSEIDFCAAASAVLTCEKINDDAEDERRAAAFAAKVMLPLGRSAEGRIGEKYAPLKEKCRFLLSELYALEKDGCDSIDAAADAFGRVLSLIFSFGIEGAEAEIAEKTGYHLGKIIYVLDAAEDLYDDIKYEKYNPIALFYKEPLEKAEKKGSRCGIKRDIAESLYIAAGMELSLARDAFSQVDKQFVGTYSAIVSNILSDGMTYEMRRVFFGEGKNTSPLKVVF